METVIPGIMLKERNDNRKRKIKQKHPPTEKMQKTLEEVKQGCSIQKAMQLAGYSEKTIKHNWKDYLTRLDIQELMRGLKTGTAILHFEILKILGEELKGNDAKDRLRAADIGTRLGVVHLKKEEVPSNITFNFQTIQGENVQVNVDKPTEAVEDAPVKEIEHVQVGERKGGDNPQDKTPIDVNPGNEEDR